MLKKFFEDRFKQAPSVRERVSLEEFGENLEEACREMRGSPGQSVPIFEFELVLE